MTSTFKGVLYAVITAVLWGVLAIALKVSLSGLTPADISWFRFFLAFVVLALYYFFKRPSYLKILRRPPWLLTIATICLAVNYFGYIKGVELASPSIAQIFIQVGPVILAISGFIFFRESATLRQVIGLFLAFAGLAVFYNEQLHLLTNSGSWQAGIVWILIAAVTWAVYSILLKVLVLKYPPMQLNLVIFGLPVLLYLPFINISHFLHLGPAAWGILLFLGLNTLFAYGLLALAMQHIEANKVSVILILNPILTFVLMAIITHSGATWIAHEHYTLMTLAGALIVLTGALLTIFRSRNTRSETARVIKP
jgi:drug/metabolite transporter (DMT)-like permease